MLLWAFFSSSMSIHSSCLRQIVRMIALSEVALTPSMTAERSSEKITYS